MTKQGQIVVMPQNFMWSDRIFNTIEDLISVLKAHKVTKLKLFTDGFPLEITTETLPKLGFWDKRAYVRKKLDILGGAESLRVCRLQKGLAIFIKQILDQQFLNSLALLKKAHFQIDFIQPYILSTIKVLQSFLDDGANQSILWVSKMPQAGVRLIFVHKNILKYVRYLNENNSKLDQEIQRTTVYLEEEFLLDRKNLRIVITDLAENNSHLSAYEWPELKMSLTNDQITFHETLVIEKNTGNRSYDYSSLEQTFILPDFQILRTLSPQAIRGLLVLGFMHLSYQTYDLWRVYQKLQQTEYHISRIDAGWLKLSQERPELLGVAQNFDRRPWVLGLIDKLVQGSLEIGLIEEFFVENREGRRTVKIAMEAEQDLGAVEIFSQYFNKVQKQELQERQVAVYVLEP